jgi:deoxyribodipyrimidine photo-lyase
MRTLYWFRNDLRLSDHPGLVEAARADALLPVYLWPRSRPWCNQHGLGGQRERFLRESLLSLREELAALGQDLLLLDGSPELVLPDLVRDYAIDAVHTSSCAGTWEARTLDTLRGRLAVPVHEHRGNTLFEAQEITSLMPELPDTFSRFRRLVEKRLQPAIPLPAPPTLPAPPAVRFHRIPPSVAAVPAALPLRGGSEAGARRLQQFVVHGDGIRRYKDTRNCLDPLDGSSTLSPWLANGNCRRARWRGRYASTRHAGSQ